MALKTVPFNVAFTFSRPDPADYEDINGETQTAGTDVPRFNYSEGVGEGLMLDASLSEIAAINDIPNFNSSSGTWVIKADLDKSIPIPGSGLGFGELMEGSGTLVFVYNNGVGKCWADGAILFTVDSFSASEPGFLTNFGLAKIQDLTYSPYAWADEDAAAKSSGSFSFSLPLPISLFSNGEEGAWYNPSYLSSLFQDSAGTMPVTADGDPVGLMLDLSPNGNHVRQDVTGAKPIYRTDGELHWLEFDGTKFMETATLNGNVFTVATGLFAAGASCSVPGDRGGIIEEYRDSDSRVALFATRAATSMRLLVHSPQGVNAFVDLPSQWGGEAQVMIGAASAGPVIRGYINGTEAGAGTPVDSFTGATTLVIGKQTTGPLFFNGNLYGAVARSTESSTDDIANITQYLAAKSGVTL